MREEKEVSLVGRAFQKKEGKHEALLLQGPAGRVEASGEAARG